MKYWEQVQQTVSAASVVAYYNNVILRRAVVEAYRPIPPEWLRSLAMEPGFVKASPVLLAYAHYLIHNPDGVAHDQIKHVFSTVPWISCTALRGVEDVYHEVRRFALLLDAVVRVFLPAIYDADGAPEGELLRRLPPLHTVNSVLTATKLVIGFLEGELKNVGCRLPNTHVLFCTVLRATAESFVHFDQMVQAARLRKLIPPIVIVDMVRRAATVFSVARKTPTQIVLDEYAVAVIGMMAQVDTTILPDLGVTHGGTDGVLRKS